VNPTLRQRVEELFEAALELSPRERHTFVERAAGADMELRDQVMALLAAHARAEGILDVDARSLMPQADRMPERLGVYRMVRELGRGGMGVVYEAERDDGQFQRRVAIKVLRAGDDPGLRQRVLCGTADPGRTGSRGHRAAAGRRRNGGRHAVSGDGARRRAAHRRLLRPHATDGDRAAALFVEVARTVDVRPPQPHRAPGPQALEHPGHAGRPAEAAGLRRGEAAEPGAGRRGGAHAARPAGADAGVRESGAAARRGADDAVGRVRAGRACCTSC
jgi:hypothetical protein